MADIRLAGQIAGIHCASNQTFGTLGIHAELADEGFSVDRRRIERLMTAAALVGVRSRKATRTTIRNEQVRPAGDPVDRKWAEITP